MVLPLYRDVPSAGQTDLCVATFDGDSGQQLSLQVLATIAQPGGTVPYPPLLADPASGTSYLLENSEFASTVWACDSSQPVACSGAAVKWTFTSPSGRLDRLTVADTALVVAGDTIAPQPGVSDYRNPSLAEALRVLGFVQRFGVGIATARRELRSNGSPPPEFEVNPSYVGVTLRRAL